MIAEALLSIEEERLEFKEASDLLIIDEDIGTSQLAMTQPYVSSSSREAGVNHKRLN